MKAAHIVLVGDFNPEIIAHNAINKAIDLFDDKQKDRIESQWLGTEQIARSGNSALRDADGIWCVPGSPYRDMDGALLAITFARTRLIPFLGTCGGYQHALLEFARHVLGLTEADHKESSPETQFPLITQLSCPLVETPQIIRPLYGSRLHTIYGGIESNTEKYNCSYGLNPAYLDLFKGSAMKVASHSDSGEVRGVELPDHPFFFGVAFQPERESLERRLHPLVESFFQAAIHRASHKISRNSANGKEVVIRRAEVVDTDSVVEILREAAHWVKSTSRLMWRDSELIPARLASDVEAGLIYVASVKDTIIGTVKFQLADNLFWPDVPSGESAFVHRLSVTRSCAGAGVSTALLDWTARRAHQLGKVWLRLDCEASRPRLRAFYEGFGFEHHSDRQVGPYFVSRYQLDVGHYVTRSQTVFK